MRFIPFGDKLGHFVIFGVLALILVFAFSGRHAMYLGAGLASAIVIIEEGLQLFAATRSFSMLDLSASLLGVVVFAVVANTLKKRRIE